MVTLIGVTVKFMKAKRALQSPTQVANALEPQISHLLALVAATAEEQGSRAWLVGGIIRDLLLGMAPGRDIDIAIEGDVRALAHELAARLNGQIAAEHRAFGTATLQVPSGSGGEATIVDLAQTRRERYVYPAALPEVEPANINDDLRRRDFSLNAMALRLVAGSEERPGFDTWLDPCGGYADLEHGVLRALHAASFDDDPTRILRGLRLATRLDLQLDSFTKEALVQALERGRLEQTGGDRLRNELCLVLEEPRPDEVIRLADRWGVTPHLIGGLCWSAELARRCSLAAHNARHAPLLSGALLAYDLDDPTRATLAIRYRLPNDAARLLHDLGVARAILPQIAHIERNSELEQLLKPLNEIVLRAVVIAEHGPLGKAVEHYLDVLRYKTPLLNGHDLQRLGVPPGPIMGRLLQGLRAARLDDLVQTREDEERWVAEHTF